MRAPVKARKTEGDLIETFAKGEALPSLGDGVGAGDFPVEILMNDVRMLNVIQRLRSFLLDRIALSILENARRGPDSPQPAREA